MKKFIVEDSMWELFPDTSIGVVVVKDMKPGTQISEQHQSEIASALVRANETANQYLTSNVISENEVVRIWREAFQKFKTKKGARCTLENLLKRVLRDNPVGPIFPAVDITNMIGLKYALPLGIENTDAMAGNFRLGITQGGDSFLPIAEDAQEEPSLPGELCYLDDVGAICRCWNWRDGQRTAVDNTTRNAIVVIENIDPARADVLEDAINEAAELIERYFDASIMTKAIVTKENPEVPIDLK